MSSFWKWLFYVMAFFSLFPGIMIFLHGSEGGEDLPNLVFSMALLLIGVLSLGFAAVVGVLQKISEDTHVVSSLSLQDKLRETE